MITNLKFIRIGIILLFLLQNLASQSSITEIKNILKLYDKEWNDAELIVQSSYYDERLNCQHYYLMEQYKGKPIYPDLIQLHIDKKGRLLSSHIRMPRSNLIKLHYEKINKELIIKKYLENKAILAKFYKENSRERIEEGFERYELEDGHESEILIQDCFYFTGESTIPAYRIQFDNHESDIITNTFISQINAESLHESKLTHDCAWEPGPLKLKSRFEIGEESYSIFNTNCYRVFPQPIESPLHGFRSVVNSPWLKATNASPLGWHDDGQFIYQSSQGNNVDCYEDMDSDNLPTGGDAARAVGGSSLNFDFTYDPALSPPLNKNSSITNLFYWNNMCHDILYQYGFHEAAGNFQYNNFGKGGLDLDNVIAEGLDNINGSRNNANYSCPPDGYPSRLQMYVWQLPVYDTVVIDSPLNIYGKIVAVHSAISPTLLAPLRSELVLVNDGSSYPTQGCSPYINGAQVNGKIALIDRGICNLNEKILNAQNAGAIAMLVCSVDDNAPTVMGGSSLGVGIPVINISKSEGDKIKSQLHLGVDVTLMPSSALKFAFNGKSYLFARASFGAKIPAMLNTDVIKVIDGNGNPNDACDPIVNNISNAIALIYDGGCEASFKAYQAQQAGARAVVIGMNTSGLPYVLPSGTFGHLVTIPVICISQNDYTEIENNLPGTGRFANQLPQLVDGDFDGGIISHEYAHGLSIRLTGGPNNNLCLTNEEQAGEGWSDFIALMMTMTGNDIAYQNRGIGVWTSGQNILGVGLRPYPYNVDKNVNPVTYGHLTDRVKISQPHGVGFVWCSMIWDLNWALINLYGFEQDLYKSNSPAGNIKAINLIVSGLKLQPCNPGFVDARNAILRADTLLNNGIHSCLIWNIFARRGLGYSANQRSSFVRDDGTEAFDLPPSCLFMSDAQLFGNYVLASEELYLSAEQNNKNVQLKWQSTPIENFSKIEIYRSIENTKTLLCTLNEYTDQYIDSLAPSGKLSYYVRVYYGNNQILESNRAIVQLNSESVWKISPVPAEDVLFISNSVVENTIVSMKLVDIQSRIIDNNRLFYKRNEKISLNTSQLPGGTYFIHLDDGNGYEVIKFIKK